LAGDFGFIEKGELGTAKQDISKIERMLKALIKNLKNKHLTPCPLESLDPFFFFLWGGIFDASA